MIKLSSNDIGWGPADLLQLLSKAAPGHGRRRGDEVQHVLPAGCKRHEQAQIDLTDLTQVRLDRADPRIVGLVA